MDFNWTKIESLVEQGYIRKVKSSKLTLYNYTHKTLFEHFWCEETEVCRGLIVNEKREIVALPFKRMFNWLESGRTSSGHIVTITEKLDGSLGILVREHPTPKIERFRIVTRGSFDGEQAAWATNFLHENANECFWWTLKPWWTPLFEIIYPDNRIVLDYGDEEALYLLAIRNRYTGEYLPFYPDVYEWGIEWGFPTPRTFDFNNVTAIIEATDWLPGTQEGWVVEFSDGQRFKFKGDRYLELHRIVTNTSFKRILKAVADGRYGALIQDVPDEFLEEIKRWKQTIDDKVNWIKREVEMVFTWAPTKGSRKEFAIWANKFYPELASYLFLKLDKRDYTQTIYKREFDGFEVGTTGDKSIQDQPEKHTK